MNKAYTLILGLFLLGNCTIPKDDRLGYVMVKSEYQTPDCQPENDACLMVKVEYPRFDKGDSIARHLANRIIKNSILDNIGMGDVESEVDLGVDEAIDALDKEFTELKQDFSNYSTGWQADISTHELFLSDSVLVLAMRSMVYFGGAHPNTNMRYYNFDRNKGNMIPLSVFVNDMQQFTTKAEVAFKKAYNITDSTSYREAGFSFLGNRFSLSANYAFLGDSIRLYYNPYEIAPYAMGDFEITVALP